MVMVVLQARPGTRLWGTTYTHSLKNLSWWPQCLAPKLASPQRHVRTVGQRKEVTLLEARDQNLLVEAGPQWDYSARAQATRGTEPS